MLDTSEDVLTRIVQEAERRRIARELHDSAVQYLTALVTELETFRRHQLVDYGPEMQELETKIADWQSLARESLLAMRQTLDGLRMRADSDFNLEEMIRGLLAEMQSLGYEVRLDSSDWPKELPFTYSSHIYSCIYEAVTNIRKHAHATKIELFLFTDQEILHISVIDNGIGLTEAAQPGVQPGAQQGLIGMQERISLLGGQFLLTSEPEQGTRIDIAIPQPR
jgi:two-component system sensor histidine kinase DegS